MYANADAAFADPRTPEGYEAAMEEKLRFQPIDPHLAPDCRADWPQVQPGEAVMLGPHRALVHRANGPFLDLSYERRDGTTCRVGHVPFSPGNRHGWAPLPEPPPSTVVNGREVRVGDKVLFVKNLATMGIKLRTVPARVVGVHADDKGRGIVALMTTTPGPSADIPAGTFAGGDYEGSSRYGPRKRGWLFPDEADRLPGDAVPGELRPLRHSERDGLSFHQGDEMVVRVTLPTIVKAYDAKGRLAPRVLEWQLGPHEADALVSFLGEKYSLP